MLSCDGTDQPEPGAEQQRARRQSGSSPFGLAFWLVRLAALHNPKADQKMVNSKDVTSSKTVVNVMTEGVDCL